MEYFNKELIGRRLLKVELSAIIFLNTDNPHINTMWKIIIQIPIDEIRHPDKLKGIVKSWKENPRAYMETNLINNPNDLNDIVFESIDDLIIEEDRLYTHPKRVTWKEYGMLQEFLSRMMWVDDENSDFIQEGVVEITEQNVIQISEKQEEIF